MSGRIAIIIVIIIRAMAWGTPAAAQAPSPSPDASAYAWSHACESCHRDIYAAWQKTKHSRAFGKLSGSEKESACVQCHVTGAKTPIAEDKKIVNAGVQCEACHGGARVHAAEAGPSGPATAGLVRVPEAAACEGCHNARSPHFKGFFYSAMASYVHRVAKR